MLAAGESIVFSQDYNVPDNNRVIEEKKNIMKRLLNLEEVKRSNEQKLL